MPERASSFYNPNGVTQGTGADDFTTRDGMLRRQAQSQDAELRARLQDSAANRAMQLQMDGSFADRNAADTHQTGMKINRDVDLARLQNQGNIATQGTFDQQRLARQAELTQAGGIQADDRTARLAHESSMLGVRGEQAMGLDRQQGENRIANTRLASEPVYAKLAQDKATGDREWDAGAGERDANEHLYKLKGGVFRDMATSAGGKPGMANPNDMAMLEFLTDPSSFSRNQQTALANKNARAEAQVKPLVQAQEIAYAAGRISEGNALGEQIDQIRGYNTDYSNVAAAYAPTKAESVAKASAAMADVVKDPAINRDMEDIKKVADEATWRDGDASDLPRMLTNLRSKILFEYKEVSKDAVDEFLSTLVSKIQPGFVERQVAGSALPPRPGLSQPGSKPKVSVSDATDNYSR